MSLSPESAISVPMLIVSPHFDDAMLSAWALIENANIKSTDVLTVFGGAPEPATSTAADRTCGFSDSDEAMRARRREDQAALGPVARKTWHLPLVELQYGGLAERRHAREYLSDTISTWLLDNSSAQNGSGLIVAAPAGAGARVTGGLSTPSTRGSTGRGGRYFAWLRAIKHRIYVRRKQAAQRAGAIAHPDHLFARDVVLDIASGRRDVEVWLYEDLPYLWTYGADDELTRIRVQGNWNTKSFALPVDRQKKCARLACYSSQLAALDPVERRLESASSLPEFERYWRLTRDASE